MMPAVKTNTRPLTGFTTTEFIVVAGFLAVVFLLVVPLLNSLREKRNRAACANNLRLLGGAFHGYAGDHNGLIPNAGFYLPPHQNDPSWDMKLISGGYAAPSMFHCPSDHIPRSTELCNWHPMSPNAGPRSYAISVGSAGHSDILWIQGSRLPCRHLPNPAEVVLVSERVDEALKARIGAKCSSLVISDPRYPVTSFHVWKTNSLAPDPRTNYLFLDGHVEWVEKTRPGMFPPVPPDANPWTPPCP